MLSIFLQLVKARPPPASSIGTSAIGKYTF